MNNTNSSSSHSPLSAIPPNAGSGPLPYRRIILFMGVIVCLLFFTDIHSTLPFSSTITYSSSGATLPLTLSSNTITNYFSSSSSASSKRKVSIDTSLETGMIQTIDTDMDDTDVWNIEDHANDPYGTPSSVQCFRDQAYEKDQHVTCIFHNLYIIEGKLRYIIPVDENAETIIIPQLLLGVPKWADNPWKKIIPTTMLYEDFEQLLRQSQTNKQQRRRNLQTITVEHNSSTEVKRRLAHQTMSDTTLRRRSSGSSSSSSSSKSQTNHPRSTVETEYTGPIYDTPGLIYQRLNPDNIYHHIWDDMLPVYTLLTEVYPQRMFAKYGSPAEVKIIFTDGHKRDGHNDDAWDSITTFPIEMYGEFLHGGVSYGRSMESTDSDRNPRIVQNTYDAVEDGPLMVRTIAAGTRGRCTHRRHCTVDIHPIEVKRFKNHVLKFYDIVSVIPKAPPRHINPTKPKAIIIARTGRRLFKNVEDVAVIAREIGYDAQIIGPFNKIPLQEQLRLIANASLAVFLHGAELGNAWLGLPEGSCASVIFPYYFTDTISWWVGSKLGINVAPYYDMPNAPSDKRLSKALNTFDDALWIYHLDITIVPWLYRTSLWCASYPDFEPPPLRSEKFVKEIQYSIDTV